VLLFSTYVTQDLFMFINPDFYEIQNASRGKMDDKSTPVSRVSSIISLNSESTQLTGQNDAHIVGVHSEWENKYIDRICEVLALDLLDNEMRTLAKHILQDGRQALVRFREQIIPVDYDDQMKDDGSSVLFEVLKSYFRYIHEWAAIRRG
jgi:hypothetical protein